MNNLTKIKVEDLRDNQELQNELNISEYIENGFYDGDSADMTIETVDLQGVILFGVEKSFEWSFEGLNPDDILIFNEKGFIVEIEGYKKI